jgi:outer membrane biosynthesis protein TonB
VQEIAIRVRLREQERVGLAEYERTVASVATVAALTAWLPTPDARLVIRGRGAEPVRLETVSYGSTFEMLVVLDQRSAAVERAAAAVAALIESVRHEHVEDDVAGVAGEIDRLDRSAPRGRSAVERSLRTFLEGARADVVARKSTTRLRAAQALVRLAEDAAEFTVERVEDALASELTEESVDVLEDTGAAVVVEPVDGLEPSETEAPETPEAPEAPEAPAEQHDDEKTKKSKKKKDEKKKSSKKDDEKKKSSKKKSSKKDDEKTRSSKKDEKKKSSKKS